MNDYDLLGLMDTHRAMKAQGLDVPDSFLEFMTGIQSLDTGENIITPQITQGDTTYDQAIDEVQRREKDAKFITNELGVGTSRSGLEKMGRFIPGDRQPLPGQAEAIKHGERLRTRQELGYDPM